MKPPTYQTIKQPEETSICGACLAAMITGHTLNHIQAHIPPTIRDGHTYYKEKDITAYLAQNNIYIGIRAIPLKQPLTADMTIELNWKFKNNPAILTVKSKVYDDGDHWVLWDGQHVRDPSWLTPETTNLEDYHILEIAPIIYSEEWTPPPSGKLHQHDCPCTTCTTLKQEPNQERQQLRKDLEELSQEFHNELQTLNTGLNTTCPSIGGTGQPCCNRAGEYNGYSNGPLSFTCPKDCPCHD